METNSILTANILDILFDGRNKEYGAYDLRKTYPKRIGFALVFTVIVLLIFAVAVAWKSTDVTKAVLPPHTEITITEIEPDKEIIPPAPKEIVRQQVKTEPYTPPLIVDDHKVKEPPVAIEQLVNAQIDVQKNDGVDYIGIIPPVEIKNSAVIETPARKETPEDETHIVVEIPATFKGNWNAYVKKEIEKHMDELTEAGQSGTCVVKFIVSKDGNISQVEAVTMKGSKLAEVVVNAIRKGPKWKPAENNGVAVNAYRQQPVTFTITE